MVSSEPGQDLEGEVRDLLFPSHNNSNASQEEELQNEIVDEIEDASLLDMIEGAARPMDIDIGLRELDNDSLDKV
jgi:hypothetical protein